MSPMINDRRTKRSADRNEALQFLVESVADRSGVRALILVDDAAASSQAWACRTKWSAWPGRRETSRGGAHRQPTWTRRSRARRDARPVATRDGMLYFAALGDRMNGLGDALQAVHRILAA